MYIHITYFRKFLFYIMISSFLNHFRFSSSSIFQLHLKHLITSICKVQVFYESSKCQTKCKWEIVSNYCSQFSECPNFTLILFDYIWCVIVNDKTHNLWAEFLKSTGVSVLRRRVPPRQVPPRRVPPTRPLVCKSFHFAWYAMNIMKQLIFNYF